jgi:hypothetical protein
VEFIAASESRQHEQRRRLAERERLVREAEAAQKREVEARHGRRRSGRRLRPRNEKRRRPARSRGGRWPGWWRRFVLALVAVVAGGLAWQQRQAAERKAGYSKIALGVVQHYNALLQSTDQICFRQRPQHHRSRRRPLFLRTTKSCHSKAEWQRRTLMLGPLPHEVDWANVRRGTDTNPLAMLELRVFRQIFGVA